jgi:hypothetical protein
MKKGPLSQSREKSHFSKVPVCPWRGFYSRGVQKPPVKNLKKVKFSFSLSFMMFVLAKPIGKP